jgi:amino acid permease
LATTLGWGSIPFQFYDMQTRIFVLIAIVGIALIWFGSIEMDRLFSIIGVSALIIGILGAYFSARNKKGMGFFRRL